MPPHNIEVGEVGAGSTDLERDAFPLVGEMARTPDCFYDTKNRYIFEAVRQLALRRSQ